MIGVIPLKFILRIQIQDTQVLPNSNSDINWNCWVNVYVNAMSVRSLAIIQQCSECAHAMLRLIQAPGLVWPALGNLEIADIFPFAWWPKIKNGNFQERSWRGKRWTSWSRSAVTPRMTMASFLMNVSCRDICTFSHIWCIIALTLIVKFHSSIIPRKV